MAKERILNKKFTELNSLKASLVSRSEENKEQIVEKIKETVEDLEVILEDFDYISEEIENTRGFSRCKGENENTFTREELKKYNGENGAPTYVAVEGLVYDVSNTKDGESVDADDLTYAEIVGVLLE